jgi:hypothetical protein
MPLRMCGSVSARLSVWFSRWIASANAGRPAAESGATGHHVKRSATLRARLGEQKGSVREVHGQEADLAGHLAAWRFPLEAAGNHQVEHQEDVLVELHHEALAQSMQRNDMPTDCRIEGRIDRPQQERAGETHPLDSLADHARTERGDVEEDVRQLGHRLGLSSLECSRRHFSGPGG